MNIIKDIRERFDLIFLDIEKSKYVIVLEDCIRLVKDSGYIIADNLSFDSCKDFKEIVLNHPRLKTKIIYLGDWLSISEKLSK